MTYILFVLSIQLATYI